MARITQTGMFDIYERRKSMENIIKYVVECDSLYGVVALMLLFLGQSVLGLIIYKTIHLVVPYLYKALCKICDTIVKYKDVHAKADVKDASFEADLHQ